MKKLIVITIYNEAGLITAEYFRYAKDCRAAIANILVNEKPVIKSQDKIEVREIDPEEIIKTPASISWK